MTTDGRVARGERTRRAIIDAHTELLISGQVKPTAQAVADLAGISVRTLWSNFSDSEALREASVQRWLHIDAAGWRPVDPELPLAERITLFCDRHADRIETMAPAARSAALGEPFSLALQLSRRQHVERLLEALEYTFSPELGPRAVETDAIYQELFVVACWPSWRTRTEDLGMDRQDAVDSMVLGFQRILMK